MYRMIVRKQYRRAWQAMNEHGYQAIIAQLAPEFRMTSSATPRSAAPAPRGRR
jgi:hypothetical protein